MPAAKSWNAASIIGGKPKKPIGIDVKQHDLAVGDAEDILSRRE